MTISPMLATAGPPPDGPGWAVEFKWDGMRVLSRTEATGTRLSTRTGCDATSTYPELVSALTGCADGRAMVLDGEAMVLDGEAMALDPAGRPCLSLLQRRMNVPRPSAGLVRQVPVFYYVFDILELDGVSLVALPYSRRRELLAGLGLDGGRVRVSPMFTDVSGSELLDVARSYGLEGVVCKKLGSRYAPGVRSPWWVKTRVSYVDSIRGGDRCQVTSEVIAQ